MIKRTWHGWTTPENADFYFKTLTETVLPGIEAKEIPGYLGVDVLRRELADEVEFTTIMSFHAIEDVIAFQGPDYTRCHVPDVAKAVLTRWDTTAAHHTLVTSRDAEGNAR